MPPPPPDPLKDKKLAVPSVVCMNCSKKLVPPPPPPPKNSIFFKTIKFIFLIFNAFFSTRIEIRRQNLTSVERVALIPALYDPYRAGAPRVVVSTTAFHARVRGSVPGRGGLKETKMFLPHPRVKVSIVGSLRDREVAC